ncbi:hypothetical protein T4C_13790, partial [Trichinella pseudospiralis]
LPGFHIRLGRALLHQPPDLPSESDVPLFYHLDKRTLRSEPVDQYPNSGYGGLQYRPTTTTTVVTKTTDPTNTSLMIFSTEGKHRVGRLQTITAKAYGAKGPGRAVICCWTQHLWLSQARGCDTAKRYPLQALTSDRPEDERADKKEVHIVINMGNYHRFFGTGIRKACLIDPVEVKTVLGCIVCGPVVSRNQCSASESLAFEMEKLYQEGIMFDETRSSVRLLWKNSELNFPNDFYMLKRWLEALERRLARKSSAVNVYPRQANTIRLQDMDNGVSERLKICSGRDRKGKMEPLGIEKDTSNGNHEERANTKITNSTGRRSQKEEGGFFDHLCNGIVYVCRVPKIVRRYNSSMGGVNTMDKLLFSCRSLQRSKNLFSNALLSSQLGDYTVNCIREVQPPCPFEF